MSLNEEERKVLVSLEYEKALSIFFANRRIAIVGILG